MMSHPGYPRLPATIHDASSTHPTTTPELVLDGNPETAWNSGRHPVGWITLDLGRPCLVTLVRLLPEMLPKICHVVHKIKVGRDPRNLETFWTLNGQWTTKDWIDADIAFQAVGRYVQIYSEQSDSWLSWRLIEIYGRPQVNEEAFALFCVGALQCKDM
jgi:hypothetical protein